MNAIFLDYTGTIIEEGGPDVKEMVKRCFEHSDIESPKAMLAFWWKNLRQYETESYAETFITEDEIVDKLLEKAVAELHLRDNLSELHTLCQRFWMYAPVFEDAKTFFAECPLPIYIVTNNGEQYVKKAMEVNNLHPAGIICGDMVKAYKPHRELFEKALEVSGCKPEEVLHIGDSFGSDIQGAASAGIPAVLLDRNGKEQCKDVKIVSNLMEVLPLI